MIKYKKSISTLVLLGLSCCVLTGCGSNVVGEKTAKVEGLGIDYIPHKLTQEDVKVKQKEFKQIVDKVVKDSGLEITDTKDEYYGYSNPMVTSDPSILDILVYEKGTDVVLYVSENLKFDNKYDIRGTAFDKVLKEIIKDDIEYDKLNNDITYVMQGGSAIKNGEIPPMIVNDVVIRFEGAQGCLNMTVEASDGNPSNERDEFIYNNIKYSYNDNTKGLVEISSEDRIKAIKLLMPKLKEILKRYYGDDARIFELGDQAMFFGDDSEGSDEFNCSLTNRDDIAYMDVNVNYDPNGKFDIRDKSNMVGVLDLVFDGLDYDDINDAINKMLEDKGDEYGSVCYYIYFPQNVSLEIAFSNYEDMPKTIDAYIRFGDFDERPKSE